MDDGQTVNLGESGAEQLARTRFGIPSLQPFQRDAVEALLFGHDCLVMQPTASGKSLCFVLPSLMQPGLTLVISPLIALMVDQVTSLQQRGVSAAFLHRDMSSRETGDIERQAEQGQLDLLFVAPERLQSNHFMEVLSRSPLGLIAIDEAHCVSSWGQDFRPDYRGIEPALARLERVPRLALTATANADSRHDIIENLALCEPVQMLRSPLRDNLMISTGYRQRGYKQLQGLLDRPLPGVKTMKGNKSVVYVPTRAGVDQLQQQLTKVGLAPVSYHAGLDSAVRAQAQADFSDGRANVMLATIAFGLGVDISDIRRVVRLGLSSSLEALLQEAGRAGRDGAPAQALVLYNERDVGWLRQQNPDHAQDVLDFLTATPDERAQVVDQAFGLVTLGVQNEPAATAPKFCTLSPLIEQLAEDFAEDCSSTFMADLLAGKRSGSVMYRNGDAHPLFGRARDDRAVSMALPSLRLRVRDLVVLGRVLIDPESGYLRPGE